MAGTEFRRLIALVQKMRAAQKACNPMHVFYSPHDKAIMRGLERAVDEALARMNDGLAPDAKEEGAPS